MLGRMPSGHNVRAGRREQPLHTRLAAMPNRGAIIPFLPSGTLCDSKAAEPWRLRGRCRAGVRVSRYSEGPPSGACAGCAAGPAVKAGPHRAAQVPSAAPTAACHGHSAAMCLWHVADAARAMVIVKAESHRKNAEQVRLGVGARLLALACCLLATHHLQQFERVAVGLCYDQHRDLPLLHCQTQDQCPDQSVRRIGTLWRRLAEHRAPAAHLSCAARLLF